MPKTVPAVYENGILRPLEPLSLPERQRVMITISEESPSAEDDVLDHEFLASLDHMDLPEVSLEDVRRALSKIPGTLAPEFDADREERR